MCLDSDAVGQAGVLHSLAVAERIAGGKSDHHYDSKAEEKNNPFHKYENLLVNECFGFSRKWVRNGSSSDSGYFRFKRRKAFAYFTV
jgi:hypothetical protein